MPTPHRDPPSPPPGSRPWRMPIAPGDYDHTPELRPDERAALVVLEELQTGWQKRPRAHAHRVVTRLERPVWDIAALRYPAPAAAAGAASTVLRRAMLARGTTFWAWSPAEWADTLCPSARAYLRRYGPANKGHITFMHAAYLLGGVTDLTAIGQIEDMVESAYVYFGRALVEAQVGRIAGTLMGRDGLGYTISPRLLQELKSQVCHLLVVNRSPYLEDLTEEVLRAHEPPRARCGPRPKRCLDVVRVRAALRALRLLAAAPLADGRLYEGFDTSGVAPAWAAWCFAWYRRNVRVSPQLRQGAMCGALMAGRWLAEHHPGITTPEGWDEDLALEYVAAVCGMMTGDYASPRGLVPLRARGQAGRPLSAGGIDARLYAMRRLFGDLEDYPHAVGDAPPRRTRFSFKPAQAFETPSPVKRRMQPDPRDIDLALWYKLVYAAATLADEDLPHHSRYPLAYWRAAALLWVSAGRRSDELRRLRVGCVRRDWVPEMRADNGLPVEDGRADDVATLCYLHVPSGKVRGPFWIWLPDYAADAVDAWLAERPPAQPPLWDVKDREPADYLFCLRGVRMDKDFINRALIPALCRRAGVPLQDARGQITSHRARSTRATILRMLGVPLDDIAEYLGHTDRKTVMHYARTNPIQLARTIQKASDLERIVEGVIDMQAAAEGRPSVRWWLGWDADGEPRYCGHPAWHTCAHRLECQKCSAFIGGEAARLLKEGEDVIPIQARVPMTPVEKAAADGNAELFNDLLAQLKDTPPPAPTSPGDIHNPMAFTLPLATQMSQEVAGDALAQPNQELTALMRSLADAERAPAGRSVLITSLKRKIEGVHGEMAALETESGDRKVGEGRVS